MHTMCIAKLYSGCGSGTCLHNQLCTYSMGKGFACKIKPHLSSMPSYRLHVHLIAASLETKSTREEYQAPRIEMSGIKWVGTCGPIPPFCFKI